MPDSPTQAEAVSTLAELIKDIRIAALTTVASTLLCMDATITKE